MKERVVQQHPVATTYCFNFIITGGGILMSEQIKYLVCNCQQHSITKISRRRLALLVSLIAKGSTYLIAKKNRFCPKPNKQTKVKKINLQKSDGQNNNNYNNGGSYQEGGECFTTFNIDQNNVDYECNQL